MAKVKSEDLGLPSGASGPGNRGAWPPARRFDLETSLVASAAIASAVAVVYAANAWGVAGRSLPAQLWCLAAAALWLVVGIRGAWPGWRWRRPGLAPLLATVAVLAAAFVVRHWMLGVLPLPDRSGFEELQMGSDGYRLLTTGHLPLEFRFTKALAAAGLWWGGPTLPALRLPFQLLGYARLIVTLMILRLLGVGRAPSGFLTLALAASRWSVITSGSAYEDFSATAVLLVLIFCLCKLDLRRASAGAWAAAAGGMAGILMFENSSFRFTILLAVGWVAWVALKAPSGPRAHWRPLAFFAGTFALVSLPMLVDIAHRGGGSIFFEAIVRYRNGRSSLLPRALAENLWKSLRTLAGFPVRISFFLAPDSGHAVQPLKGLLLLGGATAGLLRANRPFVRALVLAALGAVLACAATTDFFEASRLAPVFSILFLTGGVLLQDLGNWLSRTVRRFTAGQRAPADREALAGVAAALFYAALAAVLVHSSIGRVKDMAADVDVRNEYLNNQYLTAAYLAQTARPGSRVIVFTPGQMRDWTDLDIAHWLYAGRRLDVAAAPALPSPETVAPGTLVVLAAEGRPLDEREIGELRELARAADSTSALSFVRGPDGRPVLGSVCVRCD